MLDKSGWLLCIYHKVAIGISGSLVAACNLSADASSNMAATQPTQLHKQWLEPLTVLSSRHFQLTHGIVSVGWSHNSNRSQAVPNTAC